MIVIPTQTASGHQSLVYSRRDTNVTFQALKNFLRTSIHLLMPRNAQTSAQLMKHALCSKLEELKIHTLVGVFFSQNAKENLLQIHGMYIMVFQECHQLKLISVLIN